MPQGRHLFHGTEELLPHEPSQFPLLEPMTLPEGVQLQVTVLAEDEQTFWQDTSESALNRIWDNPEDDMYAELLTS